MRIASLVPSATEMLFALGLGGDVVGVTHECEYPSAAAELPHLTATVLPSGLSAGEIDAAVKEVVGEGRALYALDEERLAELAPDLIVTQAVCEVCAVSYDDVVAVAARLPSHPRVLQQDPGALGDVLDDVTRLGEAAGVEERASALRADLERRLEAVRVAVAGTSRARALALEWLDPPFLGGHWIPEMIEIAGGLDVAGRAGQKSPQVEWSDLDGLDPDVVVSMPCGCCLDESHAQTLQHAERLDALGDARVFAVDAASTFSRPGPRLVDGVELLGHILHPDRVDPPAGIDFAELTARISSSARSSRSPASLPDEVRAACAWVMERARWVRVDEEPIGRYAAGLPRAKSSEPVSFATDDPETAAAFAVCMNAINFGSGWWQTIRKRPGRSGYETMAAGVVDRFALEGPWSAGDLLAMDAETIATVVGQDPEHPLMPQFSAALRDVGDHLRREFEGSFRGPAEAAESIPSLAGVFAGWRAFADASTYDGRKVPFFKRAQLAAADLHRAGVADLPGLERLTAFADNLVPHVLRVDGVLQLDPDLTAHIEAGGLLEHGSPEEVELRAAAVHAVELLAAATALTPAEIDDALWNRGRSGRYKSSPRPRCRNLAY
ncbi:MAG TPA: queuosine salvage family protein [Solirubrobacterales bacterium]|nr:queuosine salvage family protein [Solirubrobacterales bacterium]